MDGSNLWLDKHMSSSGRCALLGTAPRFQGTPWTGGIFSLLRQRDPSASPISSSACAIHDKAEQGGGVTARGQAPVSLHQERWFRLAARGSLCPPRGPGPPGQRPFFLPSL